MFSQGRRDTTEVVYDILTLAQSGVSKGQIVQQGRLNFILATKYLTQLTGTGLIQPTAWSNSSEKFWLTSKGENVLRLLSQLEDELAANASEPLVPSGSHFERANVGNENWFKRLVPMLIPLATLLAGMGLGYLIP